MAKNIIEGYFVQKQLEKDGKKFAPENIGVAFNEYEEALELIERESEYYAEQPFEFGRHKLENGIIYFRHDKNERYQYTIEKCIVITGV